MTTAQQNFELGEYKTYSGEVLFDFCDKAIQNANGRSLSGLVQVVNHIRQNPKAQISWSKARAISSFMDIDVYVAPIKSTPIVRELSESPNRPLRSGHHGLNSSN